MSTFPPSRRTSTHPPRWLFAVGAVVLIGVSSGLLYLVITGKTRHREGTTPVGQTNTVPATSTSALVPRRLDGVLVPPEQAALPVRAVMIDNQIDARPWSGVSQAALVMEVPVEGGITRLMAFFDASSTVDQIGPVRSARPYFVDWAQGWQALYTHVGGSNEALDKIRALGTSFSDLNEMTTSGYFWRSATRPAPHSTYTKSDLLQEAALRRGATSSAPIAWHFEDVSTSTVATIKKISIPYGGSYSVVWTYDTSTGQYTRAVAGKTQRESQGNMLLANNVVVMKAEGQQIDDYGRLRIRTVGSGDAVIYRNGQKYTARWQRSANEPIRFETVDGTDVALNRGTTWIEVTIDDTMFSAAK